MPSQTIKLMKSEEVAEGTMAFSFTRPLGFEFRSGQSVDITLVDPPETDAEGNTRAFSIASHPLEDTLMIATRMRDSAFKRALGAMHFGTAVKMEGPFGNMTLHNNRTKAAIILTGGIGITPFRSMAWHAAKQKLPYKILLFYSNRRPEYAAFLEELQNLQKDNPNYKLIPVMTQIDKSRHRWSGETGYINREMLSRHNAAMSSAVYYIAGPLGMVSGLRAMLNQMGVDDDDVRSEDFAGY
jgi:ferredoxin-NADP reductase